MKQGRSHIVEKKKSTPIFLVMLFLSAGCANIVLYDNVLARKIGVDF